MRVLVAEEHLQGRKAICAALRSDPRLELAACVPDAVTAVARVAELGPDVVALDSDLPLGALAAAQEIRARMPGVKLILVNGPDDGDLLEALASGVSANLPHDARPDRLAGRSPRSPRARSSSPANRSPCSSRRCATRRCCGVASSLRPR